MADCEHGAELQHKRDILAIMMAILAAHDGIASAKSTALACWEEANRVTGIQSAPSLVSETLS